MQWTAPLAALAMLATASLAAAQPSPPPVPRAPAGDLARGESLYQSRCGACHSLDANRIGPAHRGVIGRRAATAPGFHYSTALAARSFVWNERNLDQWLQNPTAFVPGTSMGVRVPAAQDRADIIAYLRAQRLSAHR